MSRVIGSLIAPGTRSLVWIVLLCAALVGALMVRIPLRLAFLGIPTTLIGVTFTLAALVEIAIGPVLGAVYDKIGARAPVAACLSVLAGGVLLFSVVTSHLLVVVIVALFLPSVMLMLTPALAGIADAASSSLPMASVFGATNFLWAIGESAGALLAGWTLSDPRSHIGEVGIALVAVCSVPLVVRTRFRTGRSMAPGPPGVVAPQPADQCLE